MFPLSIEGQIQTETDLDSLDMVNYLFSNIEDRLKSGGAKDLVRNASLLRFRVGIWQLLSSMNVLMLVDSGEIELVSQSPAVVRYKFSLTKYAVATAIICAIVAIVTSWNNLVLGIVLALTVCLMSVVIDYLIASARVVPMIRKAVDIE
jgi:hypothetical protein